MTPLQRIKFAHTIVWTFFVALIVHILYAGWFDRIDLWTWVAIGFVVLEGVVLVLNGGKCPMTGMAERHGTSDASNFDIYLPEWLAKHNLKIFTTIFFAGLSLVIYRTLS